MHVQSRDKTFARGRREKERGLSSFVHYALIKCFNALCRENDFVLQREKNQIRTNDGVVTPSSIFSFLLFSPLFFPLSSRACWNRPRRCWSSSLFNIDHPEFIFSSSSFFLARDRIKVLEGEKIERCDNDREKAVLKKWKMMICICLKLETSSFSPTSEKQKTTLTDVFLFLLDT